MLLLDLLTFKTTKCKIKKPHNPKRCPFYHEVKVRDHRRPGLLYTSELCPQIMTRNGCPHKNACVRSHNRVEEFYHPEKYKSKFCSHYPDKVSSCEYGNMCAFAHSEAELSVPLLDKFEMDADFYMFHFKTVWCPISDKEHQRDQCVYAHNWQDFRRAPHVFDYSNSKCARWSNKKTTKTYKDGCPLEYRCGHAHGWKELEFHPLLYKTSECRQTKCLKIHCPFYHNEQEKRQPQHPTSGNREAYLFKSYPRNRNFANVQIFQYQRQAIEKMLQDSSRCLDLHSVQS